MDSITRPQLVVDAQKCKQNIRSMVEKARKHHISLRPHFKTHQSAEIGELYRQEGVKCITVSSVEMAKFFADNGWSDITIAFPVNIREINEIRELNSRITLYLLVESAETVSYLDEHMDGDVRVYIKIDTGYNRAGIDCRDTALLEQVLQSIQDAQKVQFKGLLVHSGHTYHAESKEEILEIHAFTLQKLAELKEIAERYHEEVHISVGDTPSCSVADDFEGADEIRPGNFVFYDLQQKAIGSCSFDQIAMVVACPVVAVQKEKHKIIIYGGGVHLSKQSIEERGRTVFGHIVRLSTTGWGNEVEDTYVSSVSQEHGIIRSEHAEFISSVKPGDLIGIVPVHACLAVNLLSDIYFI